MTTLAVPTIHSNGTSKASLQEALRQAGMALQEAMAALSATAPHQRDYYVQEPNTFQLAVDQFVNRRRALDQIADELTALYIAIESPNDPAPAAVLTTNRTEVTRG